MLHLFNKVYLASDYTLWNIHADKILIISDHYATEDTKGYQGSTYVGKSLSDAFGEKTLHDVLSEFAAGTDKVIIYADNISFAEIAASWFKSITHMDQTAYDTFVDCYIYKRSVTGQDVGQLSVLMKQQLESAPAYDFSNIAVDMPYEFLLASALVNRDFSKKSQFLKTQAKFVKRSYEHLILEARRHLDNYILDANLQTALGGSGKTIQNYKELPSLAAYKEPYFKEAVPGPVVHSYIPGQGSKIDISQGSDSDIDDLCRVTNIINVSIAGMTISTGPNGPVVSSSPYTNNLRADDGNGWKYLAAARRGELTSEESDALLTEFLEPRVAFELVPLDLSQTIVMVLLPYFKSLANSGNTTELTKFTLK
jgi:hypothetical protein